MITVLDPTIRPRPESVRRAPRLQSLNGATIAFMDNAKPMADVFLEELASVLAEEFTLTPVFDGKADPSRVAAPDQLGSLSARAHGIITGVGD